MCVEALLYEIRSHLYIYIYIYIYIHIYIHLTMYNTSYLSTNDSEDSLNLLSPSASVQPPITIIVLLLMFATPTLDLARVRESTSSYDFLNSLYILIADVGTYLLSWPPMIRGELE